MFETKLEKELFDRDVNVIVKNVQLSPNDEVDFICEKDGTYYMIEAKNYGPNWDNNFLSSSRYDDRVEGLNAKIGFSPRRLSIINSDRARFKIPRDAKLYGGDYYKFYRAAH